MLKELYLNGLTKGMDLNCAESVLFICNHFYKMNLSKESMRLSSAFGGGMCIEDKCGALTAGIMCLGFLFVKEKSHESDLIKTVVKEYFTLYQENMHSIDCKPLKELHRTDEAGCRNVIAASLFYLEQVIDKYQSSRIR